MFTREGQPFQVLLDGGYFSDLVFTGLPEFPRLGHEIYSRDFHILPGGAYNTAVALQRLGIKTAWPCRFGSDPFSQYVKEHALAEGLDPACFTQTDQPSLQITVAFSIDSERAFLSYSDPLPTMPLMEWQRKLRPDWLCASHLAHGSSYMELFAAAHELGTRVFMDCQAHNHTLADAGIMDTLRQVDVFAPNAEEARRLTGQKDCEAALEKLAELVPLVIIKMGAEGCICRQGDLELRIPGIHVQVVDTTGAGDNFNCGFLCGQVRGFSLADSLRMGNICGGLSTQGYGGTTTSPTFNELKHFLESF
jgi:sugar/nucleoside kinase (ribokinase family)